jgi:hypothetical protein
MDMINYKPVTQLYEYRSIYIIKKNAILKKQQN